MPYASRKKRKPKPRLSPAWICETGNLPNETSTLETPELSGQPLETDPTASDAHTAESQDDASQLHDRQSRNAHQPPWLPWQDRFLAAEAIKHQPFLEPRGKPTQDAWDRLAAAMLEDSMKQGPKSMIDRTGDACRARFRKLITAHKKEETLSLQKTGTDEEVNEHIETMTELVALVDAQAVEKEGQSASMKVKIGKEEAAALELRDAAMKGIVRWQVLTDIGELDDATMREKMGQRKVYPKHAHSLSPPAINTQSHDKENLRPVAKRTRHSNFAIEALLERRQAADEKRLLEAQATDEGHQQELIGGLNRLADGITAFGNTFREQMERDSELRRVEAENRVKESERQSELYHLMFQALLHKENPLL